MCGRFTLRTKMNVLVSQFACASGIDWPPRFNIAPAQQVLVLRGQRELAALRWGFAPRWAKAAQINARAETVAEKPMFRAAFRSRRCLIIADGYYEWREKMPRFYEIDGGNPFVFAGLWEQDTCALLTTAANPLAAEIHDRMPVILDRSDYDDWLAGETIPLLPFPSERMSVRQVSTYVNSARNEGPQCIA